VYVNSAYDAVACKRDERDSEGMDSSTEAETTGALVWYSIAEGE
jgi:hypothetical protein